MNDEENKTPTQSWESTVVNSFKTLNEFQKQGLFCDLIVRSKGGLEIKVHKLVMNSVSGFFRDLFCSDFKDSSENIVHLDVCTDHVLEEIVSYIYRGELKAAEGRDFVEIANVANYLQIDELKDMCILRVEKLINEETCINCWRLASEYSLKKIEEICISFIRTSAEQLFQNSSFFSVLTEAELEILLTEDRDLEEEIVFEMLVKWAENKSGSTDEFLEIFARLIDYVKFSLLSREFLLSNVLQNEVLMKDKKVLEKFAEYVRNRWEANVDFEENREGKRDSKEALELTVALKKQFLIISGADILRVSSEGKIEKFHKNLHQSRCFGYTTFSDKFLLVSGGAGHFIGTHNMCKYFSPFTMEWIDIERMGSGRSGHRCVYIDGKIYACGGKTEAVACTNSIEIFDVHAQKWTNGPEMTLSRKFFGLTVANGSLYAVGGSQRSRYLDIEMLDPRVANGWIWSSTNIPNCMYNQCVSLGYNIYCFNNETNFFIYDTRKNNITLTSSVFREEKWENFHVCELNGEIGVLFPNKFVKFSLQGEITSSCILPNTKESDEITALVAMYC